MGLWWENQGDLCLMDFPVSRITEVDLPTLRMTGMAMDGRLHLEILVSRMTGMAMGDRLHLDILVSRLSKMVVEFGFPHIEND